MSPFLSRAIVSQLPDTRWVLEAELPYRTHTGRLIVVPRGFVHDFASVPRLLRWLIEPTGRHGRAAILHDFLYWEQHHSRVIADQIFRDAMTESGVTPIVRWVLYRAVRRWGFLAWANNARDKAAGVERIHHRGFGE